MYPHFSRHHYVTGINLKENQFPSVHTEVQSEAEHYSEKEWNVKLLPKWHTEDIS